MSLSLHLAQQASAERSVIAPWMFAIVLIAVILLLGYVQDLIEQNRPS